MASLSYQMMQKFYEAKQKFQDKEKWELSFLADSLADLTDAISKTLTNENLTLDEQLSRYREAFNRRLSFEGNNIGVSFEEIENLTGFINEVTCSDQYVKNINS